MFKTLISAAELSAHLDAPGWLVFDVRHDLADPQAGLRAYRAGHLPGAVFIDMDTVLSAPKTGRNGRHPLPSREDFTRQLGALGVEAHSQIIAYDSEGGMKAARLWWMLRWIGHEAVCVLDGGVQAWQAAGLPLETALPPPRPPARLPLRTALVGHVDAATIAAGLDDPQCIIDARSPERFRGENETLDAVGGHIPGARNRFFKDNLGPDGHFKPAAALRSEFLKVLDEVPPHASIAQCGSGITACHNLLAMEIAGLSGARLYPGSWSEWSADPARPVATGNT